MYLPECSIRNLLQCIAESPTRSADYGNSCSGPSSTPSSSFVAIAVYDPIPSHDGFGRSMIDNLQQAGIALAGESGIEDRSNQCDVNEGSDSNNVHSRQFLGLEGTRTLSDQLARLVHSGGFDIAVGCDMMSAYNYGIISEEERRRAARCEMLDELEEFVLLMEHYCFVVGVAFPHDTMCKTALNDDENNCACTSSCVGERLCTVGENSPIGFREGHCMVIRNDR